MLLATETLVLDFERLRSPMPTITRPSDGTLSITIGLASKIRPSVLERSFTGPVLAITQPSVFKPLIITKPARSTTLSAPLRSLVTLTDSATTLLATTRFSLTCTPLKTQPLVMSRSRLMTRADSVWPTTTRQLALRRSSITLMAVRTQSWVQGQDQTSSLASITLTSATSLVPPVVSATKPVRSASATSRRTDSGPQPASSVVSSITSSLLAAPLLKLL